MLMQGASNASEAHPPSSLCSEVGVIQAAQVSCKATTTLSLGSKHRHCYMHHDDTWQNDKQSCDGHSLGTDCASKMTTMLKKLQVHAVTWGTQVSQQQSNAHLQLQHASQQTLGALPQSHHAREH